MYSFLKWKLDELKNCLKDRGVVISGRKAELAEKAYYAWKLGLEVAKTAKEEEEVEEGVAARRREKLTIESNITLPFPSDLKRRLVNVPPKSNRKQYPLI